MKKSRLFLYIIGFIMIVSACGQVESEPNSSGERDVYLSKLGIIDDKNNRVIDGYNHFGIELFKEISNEEEGNVFIAPYSVSSLLAILYHGCEGETKDEIGSTIGLSNIEMDDILKANRYLIQSLTKRVGVELFTANGMFISDRIKLKSDYEEDNSLYFDIEPQSMDFTSSSAVEDINKWVSKHTYKMINRFNEEPITEDTMMLLMNTIYFNGTWNEGFEKTRKKDFHNYNDSLTSINMMERKGEISYIKEDAYRCITLPYEGLEVSMYVFLPEGDNDVYSLIESFEAEDFKKIRDSLNMEENVYVRMPKFKIESQAIDLKKYLNRLGIYNMYTESGDLSLISNSSDMIISKTLHKVAIDVNENGTTAAGTSSADMKKSEPKEGEEPPVFIADRPFMFIIYDEVDQVILFMGKVIRMDE